MRVCNVPGCGRPAKAPRGLCWTHNTRAKRSTNPEWKAEALAYQDDLVPTAPIRVSNLPHTRRVTCAFGFADPDGLRACIVCWAVTDRPFDTAKECRR